MNNCKIKVNGTHPLEYQDILDVASELGYDNEDWGNLYNVNYLFLNDDGSVGFSLNGESVSDEHKELTLPQLRDLVAQSKSKVREYLVKDVETGNYFLTENHSNFVGAIEVPVGAELLTASGKELVFWKDKGQYSFHPINSVEWDKAGDGLCDLQGYMDSSVEIVWKREAIQPELEQGLISGADALRALADGKEVEFLHDSHGWVSALGLNIEQVIGGLFKLRLKPRTITLSLEFPAPMDRQPKAGERCCYVDFGLTSGFQSLIWEDDFSDFIDLWWDSEEKAKQAVAALRGIKG